MNQILEFPQPKSWEGNASVMSHVRRSVADVVSGVCERDLLGSPGLDPPSVTYRTCCRTSVNTCWCRRQSRRRLLAHTRSPSLLCKCWNYRIRGKEKCQEAWEITSFVVGLQHPSSLDDGGMAHGWAREAEPSQTSTWERERERELAVFNMWIRLKEKEKKRWYSPTKTSLGSLTSLGEKCHSLTQLMSKSGCENWIILLWKSRKQEVKRLN